MYVKISKSLFIFTFLCYNFNNYIKSVIWITCYEQTKENSR